MNIGMMPIYWILDFETDFELDFLVRFRVRFSSLDFPVGFSSWVFE